VLNPHTVGVRYYGYLNETNINVKTWHHAETTLNANHKEILDRTSPLHVTRILNQ